MTAASPSTIQDGRLGATWFDFSLLLLVGCNDGDNPTVICAFKIILKSMCLSQESTIPSTCLTAEGELSITATPGLRFRLRLKAVLPLECPATQPEEYCPQVSDLLLLIGTLASSFARAPVVALLRTARVSTCWAPR